ncbi:unnamed protein product [Danaus chrysippus]|uniref:(African queen) hypothetical protein n=1 Tax=Danaus chrysippus TaxID=151541 RepID=A0A8J2R6S0_9NEOP|nr:unnamed protein product [Danaus chrysippus]
MIVLLLVFVFITSEVKSIRNELPQDDEKYIERPCRIYDVNCIRKFFAEHSHCKITYGPVPDPLYRPDLSLHLPGINVTVTALKVEYNRLNGKIVEFYVNTKTDRLVLAVDFEELRFIGNDNYFQFQRPGKEPLVTNDSFNITYQSVGSTITIPNLKNLQLKDSEVFSYSTQLAPVYQIGPQVFGDVRLLPTAVNFLRDPQSTIPEEFLFESTFFIASFIQYSIFPDLGQGGLGNLPNTGSQLPGLGQGGIGNSGNSGSQLPGLGQGGSGNSGNSGSQLPGLGQGGIGNSGNSGSQLPGLGQGESGNSGNSGSQRDETNIERPCQSFDIYCIRRYFKKNSKCKEVLGPVPDPYYRAQSTLQLPIINATYTAFDVLYSGLNGRIVEFYINRDTDRLVIAVEFRNVTFYSKDVFFRVFRRAREPVTTFDYMYINYPPDILAQPSNDYNSGSWPYLKARESFGVSTPDDEGYIERPCRIYDVNCIRKFFAEHSRCKITYGPVPDPLYDPFYTLYLPRVNITLTSLKIEYGGLNGKIVEFYINPKTDRLVLSVDFEGFTFVSNDNYFQFSRVGREPLVTNSFFNVTYRSVSSTITIPNLKDLQLQNSEVFSFSDTPVYPLFDVGPKAFGAPDILSQPENEYNARSWPYLKARKSFGVSTPDDEGYIERPCRIYDVNCIRKFFAEHSRCRITYGPVPDPLYDPEFTLYLPRVNMTLTSLKVEYGGLNGKIVEFYINPKTDRLVLSVDFEGFTFASNDNYFQFERVGREPLVTNSFFNVTYFTVSSTITVPNLKDLQLQNSEVFSFSQPLRAPYFAFGPNVFGDVRLLPSAVAFNADIPSDILEGFLFISPFFIASFIQYSICNFGVTVF